MSITSNETTFSFCAVRFPEHPGCYLMKGEDGRILYVGKAVNLRSRLSSYFRVSQTPHRKAEMISRIRSIDVILVRNEREALILGSNLIRHLDPPYNSRFTRDDDAYYYIALTEEAFSRLVAYRKRRANYALQTADCKVALLFGPYTGWNIRNRILDVARTLYLLRSCHSLPEESCTRAEFETCLAPCISRVSEDAYRRIATQAVRFLNRPPKWRIEAWEREMKAAAEGLDFTRAAVLRDRIRAIQHARAPQVMERSDHRNIDVLWFADNHVVTLQVRDGDVLTLHGPERVRLNPSEVGTFLESRYTADAPDRIVVNACVDWNALRRRFPIYTPKSATTPLGQLLEVARINHAYRMVSGDSTSAKPSR